jgi:hypothetical protein
VQNEERRTGWECFLCMSGGNESKNSDEEKEYISLCRACWVWVKYRS